MLFEDRRSLALTEAALARLVASWPARVGDVTRNIATMRDAASCAERYLAWWEELLAEGPEALAAVVLADTDEGQVLRSIHPLAGILTPPERWAVLEGVRR